MCIINGKFTVIDEYQKNYSKDDDKVGKKNSMQIQDLEIFTLKNLRLRCRRNNIRINAREIWSACPKLIHLNSDRGQFNTVQGATLYKQFLVP